MSEVRDDYFDIEEVEPKKRPNSEDKVVRSYTIEKKYKYPYLAIDITNTTSFAIKVLKESLLEHKFIDADTPESHYNIYIKQGNKLLLFGLVHSDNLKTVLLNQLYINSERYLMIDADTRVEGDLMFSYCTSPHY